MDFMQIFTLVTGVIYIFLEIRQKNFMWIVGIVTSLAAMWVFFRQNLYASFALNTYYLITAFVGLYQWRKAKAVLRHSAASSESAIPARPHLTDSSDDVRHAPSSESDVIHLNRLSFKTVAVSALIAVAGIFFLSWIMSLLENPMSYLDSAVAVISAIATWWLVKAYLQQWWLWIAANLMSLFLCCTQGLLWMAALYFFYVLSSFYGFYHWRKSGVYL